MHSTKQRSTRDRLQYSTADSSTRKTVASHFSHKEVAILILEQDRLLTSYLLIQTGNDVSSECCNLQPLLVGIRIRIFVSLIFIIIIMSLNITVSG
jgi:hypothetical protein